MKIKKLLFLVLAFVLTFSMVACSNEQATNNEGTSKESVFTGKYIVDANYVKEHYGDDNVILMDARGEEATKKGTIEGAITTTWQNLSNIENAKKGDYDWGLILEPEVLSKKLGELGLSKDKEIILFAEGPKGWGEDGRILWTLRAAGYENVRMVDGGLKALQDIGLPKSKDVKKLDPVEVAIDALDYEHVINTKELEVSYDDYIMLDVREDKEYNGGVHYGEAKGGRLPGAIQVRFIDLFDSDGYLKSNEEITSLFENANIKKTDKVVAYCTSGIRSAYTQLIMEMLDYEVVKNYEGSYNTWCVHNEVEN
ncbi:hypothetical protein K8M07_03875 [Schnuerera sp. xch1]|uniref:sulfurtransferase n=1 Tax=Schnuerera sp. xch1 TaxID=2874283 RepID=UPI001CBD8D3E|nr:rhodanese-like domain-containing protein [Schnuerera sp. xch1]MBZ2174380.1 hypothetical protein [Schnuerera sp. xch1]